jgi:hypothetical protein
MIGVSLLTAGCAEGPFDANKVRSVLEAQPVQLDGEQVTIAHETINCGEKNDLWIMTSLGNRSVARLTQAARDLQIDDDIHLGDPGFPLPYAQLRGRFRLRVLNVGEIRDDGEFVRLVDVRVGVVINHPCFENQAPQLMAVRRGNFTQEDLPTFRFRKDGDWMYDQLLH